MNEAATESTRLRSRVQRGCPVTCPEAKGATALEAAPWVCRVPVMGSGAVEWEEDSRGLQKMEGKRRVEGGSDHGAGGDGGNGTGGGAGGLGGSGIGGGFT